MHLRTLRLKISVNLSVSERRETYQFSLYFPLKTDSGYTVTAELPARSDKFLGLNSDRLALFESLHF